MSLVGNRAPDFELEGYFKGQFEKYKLSDYRGKWVILLFYPLDFTFVCPTEVLNFSAAAEQFTKLNCQIFGISVDSVYVHKAWVETKREDGGLGGDLNYPLLSDLWRRDDLGGRARRDLQPGEDRAGVRDDGADLDAQAHRRPGFGERLDQGGVRLRRPDRPRGVRRDRRRRRRRARGPRRAPRVRQEASPRRRLTES